MPRKTLEEQLEDLEKKKAQIKARLADKDARERAAERKRDTRRKIIIGGLARVHMQRNPNSAFARKIAALIDEYVIGDTERALFDLDPLPKPEQDTRRTRHRTETDTRFPDRFREKDTGPLLDDFTGKTTQTNASSSG